MILLRVYSIHCDEPGCNATPGDEVAPLDAQPTPAAWARRRARRMGWTFTSGGGGYGATNRGWDCRCPAHKPSRP